jgi:hypothetical protein
MLRHLLRGTEELLRAASEGLAVLRARSEGARGVPPPHSAGADRADRADGTSEAAASEAAAGSLESAARQLADEVAYWLARGESQALDGLRDTLRRETLRWDLRAGEDAAARRVHDLFALLLELLGDERRDAPRTQDAPRPDVQRATERARPPRRGYTPRPRERK